MNMNPMLAEIPYGKLFIPGLIVLFFLSILFIIWAMTKRYKRIAPNEIGIIYGKRRSTMTGPDGVKQEVGFKLVTGGAVFVWPIIEQYALMSTEAFQIEISEDNIPSAKNVGVTVSGVATCRISPVPEEQMNAVQNFLGKDMNEIKEMIGQILRGHLRSIVGGLEVEELLRERSKFNEMVLKECGPELARMGIKILTLVVQDVKDKEGYIEALGKQAVAGAKRDAAIATAEADRETQVKTSDAKRTAAEAVAKNDAMIKQAEKNRDIQVAEFKLETATKQAAADIAGELAQTDQRKKLVVLQAEVESEQAKAQTKVQELEAIRKQKELEATTIVTAEAEAKAMSIRASGKQKAEQIEAETRSNVSKLNADTARQNAEGTKNAAILEGEGEAKKTLAIAEAKATATQKTMTAEADGERAKLLAVADGQKAGLLATAEGLKASKLAEAEGTMKLAEALAKLNQTGQLVMVLDRLPGLLKEGGDAGAKIAAEIFGPMGTGIGAIKDIRIIDMGGGKTAEKGIAAVGGMIPDLVANFFAKANLQGIDLTPLFKFLKMDPAALKDLITPLADALPEQPAAPATVPTPPAEKK